MNHQKLIGSIALVLKSLALLIFLLILITCKDNELLLNLKAHKYIVSTTAISPNGCFIASGGGRYIEKNVDPFGELFLWDARDGHLIRKFNVGEKLVTKVAFDPGGQSIITAANYNDYNNNIYSAALMRWDIASGKLLSSIMIDSQLINAFAIGKNGQVALNIGNVKSDKLRLYLSEDWKQWIDLDPHIYPNRDMAFSPDGRYLALVGSQLEIWDIDKMKVIREINNHGNTLEIGDVIFSNDGQFIITHGTGVNKISTYDAFTYTTEIDFYFLKGGAVVLDFNNNKIISHFNSFDDGGYSACFTGQYGYYLVGGKSKIYLVNFAGKIIHTFRGHNNPVVSLSISQDGSFFVSGSHDGTVKVWRLLNL
jgi:WD40 repeat protein